MRRSFAQQHGGKRFAINALRHRATTEFDEGGQHVRPGDHGIAARTRRQMPRPLRDERDADARVVEVPFAKRPLRTVIGGVDEERVSLHFVLRQRPQFTEQGVGTSNVRAVAGALFAGFRCVHMLGRQLQCSRIIACILTPGHMRVPRAEEQAERLGGIAGVEKFRDLHRVAVSDLIAAQDIETVVLAVIPMRDFAKRRDFVPQHMQRRRQGGHIRILRLVIWLRAIARRPQARAQRRAARSAGRCGDKRMRELHALRRQLCHVRCANVRGSIGLGVQHAVIV